MTWNDLIFTKTAPDRFYRHFAFWASWYFIPVLWEDVFTGAIKDQMSWEKWLLICSWQVLSLGFNVIYCYFTVYFLVPRFLAKRRFFLFTSLVVVFTIAVYALEVQSVLLFENIPQNKLSLFLLDFSRHFITAGPPVICLFFITLKILKDYYQKLDEKATLIRETSGAELQLLKAQVHPHFLFNTLNNIYSFTLNDPPKAAGLVLKLSHTVQYMTTDCEAELVTLEKELKMIEDYIGLEKVRYGKRLDLRMDRKGHFKDKYIAPLLLIPFVENSFKHGSSKMLEHPWIRIEISTQDKVLLVKVSNSKPATAAQINGASGIGLKNVKKRLELLYHEDYHLEIKNEDQSFHVELRVPLTVIEMIETQVNDRSLIAEPTI